MTKGRILRTILNIFIFSAIIWGRQVDYLTQTITIENSLRDKISSAIAQIIERDKFVVIVNIELAAPGSVMPKTSTLQSGVSSGTGYSPIPGLPTVPAQGSSEPTVSDTAPARKKGDYSISRVNVTVYLEETLASGPATQDIKTLVEQIIPETRDCTDCVRVKTMRFQSSQHAKAYEDLEKKIEKLENERRHAERVTDSIRYADITRQLTEAEDARSQWQDQARIWELYQIKKDSVELARYEKQDRERKQQDSLALAFTKERLDEEIRERIESETETKDELLTIVKHQTGILEGDEESLLGMQLGSNKSNMTGNIIMLILVLALVGLAFLGLKGKKPQPIYLKPKSSGEEKPSKKEKKKKEKKGKNDADKGESEEEIEEDSPTAPTPPPPMPPAPSRADEDTMRSEIRSLRQSAISLTVGEKEGASKLIKEWLEDKPGKEGEEGGEGGAEGE